MLDEFPDTPSITESHEVEWTRLRERFLPIGSGGIWSFNRDHIKTEPTQGWKLHISATIVEACDVFKSVVPILEKLGVNFKAPISLYELARINSGIHYGYSQVGKFITVYSRGDLEAVELAGALDTATARFWSVTVPYDMQFGPGSSVFYRYGAFLAAESGEASTEPACDQIVDSTGVSVDDDRTRPIPAWIESPFPGFDVSDAASDDSPIGNKYGVFKALSQRGKGGTFLAVNFTDPAFPLCIIKEGRRNGEVHWNGQDGYELVRYEGEVLRDLARHVDRVPKLLDSFESEEDHFIVLEAVEGISLLKLIKPRRRRLTMRRIMLIARELSSLIAEIHRAGWVWNDCKPANVLIANDDSVWAIDFENAFRIGERPRFDWSSKGFAPTVKSDRQSTRADLFSFAAVIYFLLTGRFFDSAQPVRISRLRRRTPAAFAALLEELLLNPGTTIVDASDVADRMREFSELPD